MSKQIRLSWLEIEPGASVDAQIRLSWLEIEEGPAVEPDPQDGAPPVYGGKRSRRPAPRALSEAEHVALVREKWDFIDAIRAADEAAAQIKAAKASAAGASSSSAPVAPLAAPAQTVSTRIDGQAAMASAGAEAGFDSDDDEALIAIILAAVA